MNTVSRFADMLKKHLAAKRETYVRTTRDWTNGNTDYGFPNIEKFDFDALCKEIDKFTQEFSKSS